MSHSAATSQREQPDQLPFVTESLKELNKFLQPDKSIRMILFMWSRFSPKCAELIKSIPNECKRFFYYINIDNPDVRDSIINSSSIKVTEVPCVIVVQTDGVVSTYEGDSSIDIIKSVYSIVQKIIESSASPKVTEKRNIEKRNIEQRNIEQRNIEQRKPSSTVTPLSEILGVKNEDEKKYNVTEGKYAPQKSPVVGPSVEDEMYENDLSSLVEDSSSRHSAVRSKIRRAERPMDDNGHIKREDPPKVGLSSARTYPTKGMGHDGLARSSLGSDIKRSNKPKQEIMPISGGEMLDDELDDMLDEDLTMDPIIRDVGKTGRTDKKESMMNVKKAAEEMKRMRDQEEENDEQEE